MSKKILFKVSFMDLIISVFKLILCYDDQIREVPNLVIDRGG